MADSTTQAPKRTRKPRPKARSTVVRMPTQTPFDDTPGPLDEPDPAEALPDTSPASKEAYTASQKAFPPAPRGTGKGGYCKDTDGMLYWRTLPAEFQNRLNVYVNREWPILNRIQELSAEEKAQVAAKKRREPYKYIDKPAEPFGPDTRQEFLQRYGSGIYKVFINDAGVKGAPRTAPELQAHNLCRFVVTVTDSDFPPVLDPSRPDKGLGILDRKHPQNQSYIAELQTRGVLPLEIAGEEMQQSQVVKDLADKVGTLADKVAGQGQAELLREVKEAMKGKESSSSNDLILQLMLAVVNRPAAPPPDAGTSPIITLFQTQMQGLQTELQAERAERRKYEDGIRERANQPPPDPFAFFERMTKTLETARQLFGAPGAAGAATETVRVSRMSGTMEFLSDLIPKVINAPILTSLAARIAAPPIAIPNPAGPGAAAPSTDEELLEFVQKVVTPAMVSYLEADSSGGDFAEWVFCGFSEKLKELQQRGPDTIIATYQRSALWPRLVPREIQFRQFVKEFCAWETESDEPPPAHNPPTNGAPGMAIDLDAQLEGEPIA